MEKYSNEFEFPKSFMRARNILRSKFRLLDLDTIDDSIQYAQIEYWLQNINQLIVNESQAFNWFMKVAKFYLYKEMDRSSRHCDLGFASNRAAQHDIENHLIYRDLLEVLISNLSNNSASIVILHANGYSLKELTKIKKISLNAVKQCHSRACKIIKKKAYSY